MGKAIEQGKRHGDVGPASRVVSNTSDKGMVSCKTSSERAREWKGDGVASAVLT